MTNTNIVREGNSEISGSRGGGDGDVSSYDDFALQNESEGEEFKRNFREDTGRELKSASSFYKHQSSVDIDKGDSHENNADMQIGDRLEVSSITAPDFRGGECPIDTENVVDSNTVKKAKTQIRRSPYRKFLSTPPMSSSKINVEQST
ncbi:hypothetical protein COCC4DRAFT_22041 [Bipolaris maydis ATCC 48331]|uniref:Uncharacterized protein n=2 Tax=Cochliobolus heterostrophus TaxID=5016 RepID=M2UHR0_COCH5|nr:uncharacterized protein COCC4DRAFT_22041 [Bipolaris maydis ATCC 48331]EMD93216.1 hypothetical protein COCHEDRAFT_1028427 [Bipolaris maydis C5]ENI07337.1 hypothetical protein COCC4DRAFT_22041 [Bipolaris maydis ATCC 48331]